MHLLFSCSSRSRFDFSAAIVPLFVALSGLLVGCRLGADDSRRGNDPWVFRSVVDLQPRMITLSLRDDFWVSYNTATGELYRAWPGGMDFAGSVYNQSHGPQPTSRGPAYVTNETGGPWRVRTGDVDEIPSVQYKGHALRDAGEGESVVLKYVLTTDSGARISVHEMPEYVEEARRPGLKRVFETANVPPGAAVILRTGVGSAITEHELGANDTTVVSAFYDRAEVAPFSPGTENADAPSGFALAEKHNCQICHNVEVATVGPSFTAIAERYGFTSFNVDRLSQKVIAGGSGVWGDVMMTPHPDLSLEEATELVEYILGLDGEMLGDGPAISGVMLTQDQRNSDGRGLATNVWLYAGGIPGMVQPSPSEAPMYSGVVPNLNISGAGFAPLEENFYLEARGSIRIDEPGNYVFRTVSDDGSLLYIDGAEVVNNDGFHGPDPADGEIQLERGDYEIFVRFFQGGGGRTLSMQWVAPGEEAFSIVPSDVLTYREEDLLPAEPYVAPEVRVKGIPGDQLPLMDVHPSFSLETIRPDGFEPMVGGLDVMADGRVAVSTWDPEGAVYIVDPPATVASEADRNAITVKKIASGLAEPLGLKVVDGEIYVLQKHELTRLVDNDGDEVIDEYQTVANGWGATANFHEFAFGLEYRDGFFYAALATAILPGGASANPQDPDRGRVIKIDRETGDYTFIASGLRTPNGIGVGVDGELFIADNQGDWLPSSKVVHVSDGAFFGSRSVDFPGTAGVPEKAPVVWLPQGEIGNSPSTPARLDVGRYAGQMIHGEVTHGGLKRVFVEQVDGEYQGAVFRFVQGLEAGVNRIVWGADDKLYVGGIGNPGNWGHSGGNWFGLQRLTYTDAPVFEMLSVNAKSDGLELTFTEPLAAGDGFDSAAYEVRQWRYVPTVEYGGPKVDDRELVVRDVHVSEDRRRVALEIDGMRPGHVVYVRLRKPWISTNGNGLWTREAWYTLNRIPRATPVFKDGASEDAVGSNELTAAEQADGWRLLFDGSTLEGWRNYNSETVGSAWRVEDGAITIDGPIDEWQTANGGDIMTDAAYENYDLRLQWKVEPGGNSGIIYNVVEDPKYEYVWETGPEMQVLDNDGHPDGAIPGHRAGELYDLVILPYEPVNPAGEWNDARIVQQDGLVSHWLNGHKLLEVQIGSPEWEAMVAASKFIEMPDFGKATAGHIALQDHGNRVWFRNIKIRER